MQALNRFAEKAAAQHQTMFLDKQIAAGTIPENRKAIVVSWEEGNARVDSAVYEPCSHGAMLIVIRQYLRAIVMQIVPYLALCRYADLPGF
ncbi:MAG: hypothetical protein ACXWT1_00720 [Methylobacter sp.]